MPRQTYKNAYEAAKLDLLRLARKRQQLDSEIRKLHASLKALGELCGIAPEEVNQLLFEEGGDSSQGFTDSIRRIFRTQNAPLKPPEIRSNLLKMGIGREQVNLLASIHTVLRRLVKSGEIKKTDDARFRLAN
jgi:hypothetical protein